METVLISALEHWSYCPRQCGLIHLECVWDENVFTIRGNALHERVDEPTIRTERGRRAERALPVWSETYGLQGRADLVEFLPDGTPFPVEYKSGKARKHGHAEVQLCAQSLCLEEMLGFRIEQGALFFAASQKREPVPIDADLRHHTLEVVEQVREMLESETMPPPTFDRRCRDCSLADACLSQTLTRAWAQPPDLFKPVPETDLPW